MVAYLPTLSLHYLGNYEFALSATFLLPELNEIGLRTSEIIAHNTGVVFVTRVHVLRIACTKTRPSPSHEAISMYPGIRRGRSRTLYNTQRGCGKFAVVVVVVAAAAV